MLGLLFYILVGIAQGILEWLPVSSEGQITLLAIWFGKKDFNFAISLAFWVHFGTLLAVLVIFRTEWWMILNLKLKEVSENSKLSLEQIKFLRKFLIITTIATGVTGVPINFLILDKISDQQATYLSAIITLLIGLLLIVSGLLIYLSRKIEVNRDISELSNKESTLVGLSQGFTILPGVSRSGTTVSVLLLLKIKSEDAFFGSFLMSVPAVLGAIALDLLSFITHQNNGFIELNFLYVSVSIIFAFIFGLISLKILLDVARKYDFSKIVLVIGIILTIVGIVTFITA